MRNIRATVHRRVAFWYPSPGRLARKSHGRCPAGALRLRSMSIAREARPAPARDRSRRRLIAGVLAAALMAAAAVPLMPAPGGVFAVDPSPRPRPPLRPRRPGPTPAPTPAWPKTVTTLGSTVRFYGRGYGHGVGLNQYGARGRALAGQTAEQILKAYFKGTTLSTTSPTRTVRVLILAGFPAASASPLVVYGRSGSWEIAGVATTFPADAVLKAWRTTATVAGVSTTTWKVRVTAADGATVLHSATISGVVTVRPVDATSRIQVFSKPSSYDTYRGSILLRLGSGSVNVVNSVRLDDYLRGVVPVEMPSTWPAEALRAQAVAARSYAVRRLHPSTGSYDLYDDTRSQVYRGLEAEKATTSAIIAAAPGAILVSAGSVVNAFFHSTGGGATENNEYAFVGSTGAVTAGKVGYLRGIVDRAPDGKAWDAAAPYYAWATSSLTRAQLSAMLRTDSRTNVGDVLRLNLTRRGVSGRLYQVVIYGSSATKTVSADVFRSVYNAARPSGALPLRSNLFDARPLP